MPAPVPHTALRILLTGIVDYAGLFPPAGLTMTEAVANYDSYLNGTMSWMLGRFIVTAARLAEFEEAAERSFRRADGGHPWHLSMLAGEPLEDDLRRLSRFNTDHHPHALIDTVELKAAQAGDVQRAVSLVPENVTPYVEVPSAGDPAPLIASIARAGARAKVRTGGLSQEMFPSSRELVSFIAACVREHVPFKATAGLHHPLRSCYRLTYEKDSPKGMMYGFLNVFLAAAFIANGIGTDAAASLLEEQSAAEFHFRDDGVEWRGHRISNDELSGTRQHVAVSFGSCSFREPVEDLHTLQLL